MAQATRMFRIFVSSTFGDLQAERNALQEQVWPRLRKLCSDHGTRFQAVDLRWGVNQEASLDQQTMAICLEEIARCRRVSPRPNFLVLLGDRYGSRFLPARIPAAEFEALGQHLIPEDLLRLKQWYWRDENAVPAEYRLQPRTAPYDMKEAWEPVERELRDLLLAGLRNLPKGAYDPTPYLASATEQEIMAGVFSVPDTAEHVHCFFRTIEGLPDHESAGEFLALDAEGHLDNEARARLDDLKRRLRGHLPSNVHEYQARWTAQGITTDHLTALCEEVYTTLERLIEVELARMSTLSTVDREDEAHRAFGEERRRQFHGREQIRRNIARYLADTSNRHILMIHGVPGIGKSALLAQASEEAGAQHPGAALLVRFIGATPQSANARTLLQDLCQQISYRYGADASTIPTDYDGLVQEFPKRLALANSRMPLFLFLDALDQLQDASAQQHARTLIWLPSELPDHVHLVATSQPGEDLIPLQHQIPEANVLEVEPMSHEDGGSVLDLWLAEAHPVRTLQPAQRNAVLSAFGRHGLPLYLRVAFEEARHWTSYTPEAKTVLDSETSGIIRQMFTRLSDPATHGPVLVGHGLGFLAAAKDGLSEDEIVDVLSQDQDVMADLILHASKASPATSRLPIVIWSRLYFDLEPYLSEHDTEGARTLAFYHRQLAEIVAEVYLSGEEGVERHRGLASYFAWPGEVTDANAAPNLRALAELPYQQTRGEMWDEVFTTLTDFRFLEQKATYLNVLDRPDAEGRVTKAYAGVYLLQDDYALVLASMPNK